jgi:hypothetical protein
VAASLLAATGCGSSSPSKRAAPPDSSCRPSVQDWEVGTAPATLTRRLPQLGAVRRDASATIVAVCQRSSALPRQPPVIRDGHAVLQAGGGVLSGFGPAWVNYWIFPPTRHERLQIELDDRRTTALFAAPNHPGCALSARPPFRVDSCGVLTDVSWSIRVPFSAARAVTAGAEIRSGTRSGRVLGYYLFGLAHSQRSSHVLTIKMAFKRPQSTRVLVRLGYLATRKGTYSGPLLRRWFVLRLVPSGKA